MKIVALATIAGFACLLLWDIVWVFWTIGVVLVVGGFSEMSDSRQPDKRFKNGFKGNAKDTSDVGLGFRLLFQGIVVLILAFYARDLLAYTRAWLDANSNLLAFALLVVLLMMIVYAVYARRQRNRASSEVDSAGLDEPDQTTKNLAE